MKATIEIPRRPIPADERFVGGVEDRRARDRLRGPTPIMAAAAMAIVLAAAAVVWAMVGDSGAQLVETETASPPMTAPRAEPPERSAHNRVGRNALRVTVGDPAVDAGVGTEQASTTAPVATTGGDPDSELESDAAQPSGRAADAATIGRASPVTALETSRITTTSAGSSTASAAVGSGTASTTVSTPAPTASRAPSTPLTTRPPSGGGVAWEEHFDGLDTGRWEVEHSTYGDGNGERQCYQPQNVRVANGRLVLTAKAEDATCPNGRTRTVTSGMVRSRGLTFSPGQAIEFRVKLTPPDPSNQAGLWPAVWASSWAGSWPRGGELDFLEVMTAEDPRRAVFSLHYADRSGGHELQNKAVPMSGHFSDGWHTIRFDYGDNGNLVWSMDGSRVFSVSAANTAQGYPAPFDQTIREIKVNLAVGGTPGPLAAGALGSAGATFEIDYIKVFDL